MQVTLLGLVVSATLAAGVAFGQVAAMNGEITGTVLDPSGAPITTATVKVVNPSTGYERSARTSSAGLYRVPILPLGDYSITIESEGFATYQQDGIVLNAGTAATVDVKLQLRSVTTEVHVSSDAPIVDVARTDQGSTLTSNAIVNLPLVSRNPLNFILQQPNVSGRANTEFGVPRKLNANGFNNRVNYLLDGSNNVQSDRAGIRLLPISQAWIQEIQAVNNGFAPEFGNTVGTVFNTITRSGTNELHGTAGYLFRRTPMSARPALLPEGQPTPEVNVDSVLANAGGRLVEDRAFFFVGYERVKRDLPVPVTVPPSTIAQLGLPSSFADPIPFSQNISFFIGKIDWHLNSDHRLSMRYNGHRNNSPYNSSVIGGLFLVDRTYEFVDRSHAGAAQLVSVLSPNAVNELRLQVPIRTQSQNRFEATGAGPSIMIPGVASFGNSIDVGFRYDELSPELTENFSYNHGQHAMKVGGSIRLIRDTQVQATAANYTFPNVAAYLAARDGLNPRAYISFIQTVGDPSLSYNSLFAGFYAQDTWKPRSNVTLVYGIRYDVYRPPAANESSPFPYSREFQTDKNNVAPRLGVAIRHGKTVVRASAGIFYDPFQTDLYRRALLNNGTPQFFAIALTPQILFAPPFPNVLPRIPQGVPLPDQDITTVVPDFANLYSINANLSVSRELARDLALTATYLYTRGNRLPVLRNINLVPSGQQLADGRPVFGTGRTFPEFGNILAAESVGQTVYSGLNLTLSKRFSQGFELFGTYTWSHAIDDAPEQNNIDSPNFVLSDPSNRRRDRGNSLTDRRHAFNGYLVYTPSLEVGSRVLQYLVNRNQIAIMATIQSGDIFNIGSNRVLNGDPLTTTGFQRPLFVGRNTIRGPRTSEFDIRYTRLIPLTERMNLEFIAESTNVFNRTNVVGLNTTATVDPAGNIIVPPSLNATAALDQRLLQLGFRISF